MDVRQTRVLIVDNRLPYLISHRLPLASVLRDRGWDVHTTALTGESAAAVLEAGFPFHALPITADRGRVIGEISCVRHLASLYRRLRPDL